MDTHTPRARQFVYTMFNWKDGDDEQAWIDSANEWHQHICKDLVYHSFQLERCPSTDNLHFQGYVQADKQIREGGFKLRGGHNVDGSTKMWCEGRQLQDASVNNSYTQEPDTRVAGPWIFGTMKGTRGTATGLNKTNRTFDEALSSPTLSEGSKHLRENSPKDWVLHSETFERAYKKARTDDADPDGPPAPIESFLRPPYLGVFNKAHLFWGKTGLCKTFFAAAHFKFPCIVSNRADLKKEFNPDRNDGIVFDDWDFTHEKDPWGPAEIIALLDYNKSYSIKVLYGSVTIPKNFPRVFTFQDFNPFYSLSDKNLRDGQDEAINRRITKIHITTPLWVEPVEPDPDAGTADTQSTPPVDPDDVSCEILSDEELSEEEQRTRVVRRFTPPANVSQLVKSIPWRTNKFI